jgi:drug/metabolite transporter (DMT)-like permease
VRQDSRKRSGHAQRQEADVTASPAGRDESGTLSPITAGTLSLVLLLTLVWGFSWPVMKIGVTELAPLTFRAITLPFSALSMLAFAKLSGDSILVPRRLWGKVAALALFNISAWNGLVLFGVQQLPSGRSAILAYTMPIWTVLFSLVLLHEPLSKRKLIGMALGMTGMAVLLGDDVRHFERTPQAALFFLGAALTWAFGIVLVRKWRVPLPPNTLSGWMILLGWLPIIALAPLLEHGPIHSFSAITWFAILYNVFLAGALAQWAWLELVRRLPVVVTSMSSLPVPIVGVFAGMLVLGERPGLSEWTALALVVAAMVAVFWPQKST